MKRIMILLAMMLSTSAFAQVGGIEFTPYTSGQSQMNSR